jgi:phospholipase/carboxylesterase
VLAGPSEAVYYSRNRGVLMNLIHSVFEPAGDGPHPAIIALHGWGANALDLMGLAPYIAGGKFMVICPQGPMEVPVGPVVGYGWFPIRMGTPPREDQIDEAVDRASEFIDAALKRYPVNPRKLVMLGFSQGGVMAFRLAFRSPERFAALVGISTWFPPELKQNLSNNDAIQQLPTLLQHGRADDMIELSRAKESLEHLRELKVPVTFREYDCGHEITASSLEDLSEFLSAKVISPIITAR